MTKYAVLEKLKTTPAECDRVQNAPFQLNSKDWATFCASLLDPLLEGYKCGESSLERVSQIMWDCSIGCDQPQRLVLVGMVVALCLKTSQKSLNARPPDYPKWLRYAAVEAVLMIEEDDPTLKKSPELNRESSISRALEWLKTMKLDLGDMSRSGKRTSLKPLTLYGWVNDFKRAADPTSLKRGPRPILAIST